MEATNRVNNSNSEAFGEGFLKSTLPQIQTKIVSNSKLGKNLRFAIINVVLSGFVFLNLFLFDFLDSLGVYGTASSALKAPMELFIGALSILLVARVLTLLYFEGQVVWRAHKNIPFELIEGVGIAAFSGYLSILAYYDPSSLIELRLLDSLSFLVLMVSILSALRLWLVDIFAGLSEFRSIPSNKVQVLLDPSSEESRFIDPHEVQVGALVLVAKGGIVPFDGTIVRGRARICSRERGGIGFEVFRLVGDEVFAGSTVLDGDFVLKVGAILLDSAISTPEAVFEKSLSSIQKEVQVGYVLENKVALAIIFCAFAGAIAWFKAGADGWVAIQVFTSVCLIGGLVSFLRFIPIFTQVVGVDLFKKGLFIRDLLLLREIGKTNRLVLDISRSDPLFHPEVTQYEVLDQTTDEEALAVVVVALLSRFEDPILNRIRDFLSKRIVRGSLGYRIDNSDSYPSLGVAGSVNGIEVSVGNESFMIDRGVHVQTSDVVQSQKGELYYYIAIGFYIVGRVRIAVTVERHSREVVKELAESGIETVIVSEDPSDVVDSIGRLLGVELSRIFGGLQGEAMAAKVRSLSPYLYMARARTLNEVIINSPMVASVFDPIRYEFDKTPITLLEAKIGGIASIMKKSKELNKKSLLFGGLIGGSAAILLGLSLTGILAPGVTIIFILAAIFTSLAIPVSFFWHLFPRSNV